MNELATDPNDPSLGGNGIGGDPLTWHPALWQYLIDRFDVSSMLDVGCGEGHCVGWFTGHGVDAYGFDGLRANVENAVAPIELWDLRAGPYTRPVDLVHCAEVVEHVSPEFVGNVLDTLANGRVIALTHALPGQPGYHHVNCQPPEYWVRHLEDRGYRLLELESFESRAIVERNAWTFFVRSGLIFERIA
jgi:SAM-dependent methyltransferase